MIYKHGHGLYDVAVSPPDGSFWRSAQPMTVDEIVDKLIDLGCHTTDISDAFYAVDPYWTANEGKGRTPDQPG